MEKEQLEEIEKRLKELPMIELDYFRNWLMDNYPICALNHDVGTIIRTMNGVDAEYEKVEKLLKNIHDRSTWKLDESYFIENEKSGYYQIIEAQQLMENLTETEYDDFLNILIEKYPVYKKMKVLDYISINNSFGEDNYPKWEEVLLILKKIK